jgi:hypothetical protein
MATAMRTFDHYVRAALRTASYAIRAGRYLYVAPEHLARLRADLQRAGRLNAAEGDRPA